MLAHERLSINTTRCQRLTNALETQGYDKKGEPEKWDTHPAIDDWCFSGNTKIIVNDKVILFKDIPESGLIKGAKGNNILFFNGGYKGRSKLFAIKLINGKIIHATKDHEFLTLNGWIKAENLAGETICHTEYYQRQYKSLMVENTIKALTGIFTKRLAVTKQSIREWLGNQYIGQHGRIITEKLKKVLSFIIRMKTKTIMIFQILPSCEKESTTHCTLLNGINNTQSIQEHQLKKHSQNAESGIHHEMVKNGINNTMKTIKHCFIKKQLENARYAQKSTNEKNAAKINIVQNWLPRYTGMPLEKFGKYILLVNFKHYIQSFSEHYNVQIYGEDKAMQACTFNDITIINFGMGSANAATVMDLLTAIKPKACLFLGKCGSLKDKIPVDSMLLPIGAIRGEGTSNDYLPREVPALPSFQLERAVSHIIKQYKQDYFSGTVYTTNRRVWEHDDTFKDYLINVRATAIDMETATIFITGFHNEIPTEIIS